MSRLLTYSYSIIFLAVFWSQNVLCKDVGQPVSEALAKKVESASSQAPLFKVQVREPSLQDLEKIKNLNLEKLKSDLPALKLRQGGGSSNGGGSGVVCANQQTTSLETLELSYLNTMVVSLPQENALSYLNRVLTDKMKPISPLFYKRIQTALNLIFKNPWVVMSDKQMPLFQDAGEIKTKIPQGCERVQIFIRQSEGREGRVAPEITMFYNPTYFNNLKLQDQAVLLLHEALYVMGSELGHANSANVRKLAILLLSESFYLKFDDPSIAESPREQYIAFLAVLGNLEFDTHIDLFQKPLFELHESAAKREKSFVDLIQKMNRFGFNGTDRSQAPQIASDFLEKLMASLTREEAFLYLAMTFMNYPWSPHVETFAIENQPLEGFIAVCTRVERIYLSLPPAAKSQPNFIAFEKALGYCRDNMDMALWRK